MTGNTISVLNDPGMIDIDVKQSIEVERGASGTIWINVDGVCRLRINGFRIGNHEFKSTVMAHK